MEAGPSVTDWRWSRGRAAESEARRLLGEASSAFFFCPPPLVFCRDGKRGLPLNSLHQR